MNVLDLVSQGLLAIHAPRDPSERSGNHRVGACLGCIRARNYELTGVAPSDSLTVTSAWQFSRGRAIEEMCLEALKRAEVPIVPLSQIPLYHQIEGCKRLLAGYIDCLLATPDLLPQIQEVREYCEVMGKLREAEDWAGLLRQKRPNTAGMEIVEWKTIQARQKRYLAKEGPRDTYVAQLALYIRLLRGRGDGKLVYVVADNGWRKEYRVTVDGDDVFVNDARFASITAYLDDFRRVDAVVAEGKVPLRPYEPKVTKSGLYDLAAYEAKRNIWNCNPRWCRYSSWCLAGVPKGPKIREKEGFF